MVVGLVVVRFERYPTGAEAVVLGDQLLGRERVVHPPANLVRDELAILRVRFLTDSDLGEVAEPDAEAGRGVEPLPQLQTLLFGHILELALIGPWMNPPGVLRQSSKISS